MDNSQADKPCTLCVYPLPSSAEPSLLRGAVAVVIDVLRATTVFTFAKHSGVREIIPVLDIETAQQLKRNYPSGEVLLGGERQGLPIEGFDLGNSPQHYTPEMVAGKTLIITTTNGTVAMHAARPARSIYIASFLNARAVAAQLQNEDNIAILCAGTNGKESEEDLLLAGCLTARLAARRNYQLNEAAVKVAGLWHEPIDAAELEKLLRTTTGGKAVLRLGLEPDLIASAQLDTIDIVPEL
jgi:2-phosphosulfolactate phosphatase